MKKMFFILSLIVLLNQCILKPKESNIKIQVKVIDKIDINKFKDFGCYFYSVDIELCNNTDTLIQFWTMTCSWQDNWISTTDSLRLFNEGCTRNFPKIEQINPRGKMACKSIICVMSSLNYIKKKCIKLGFVLIKKNEISKDSEFAKVLSKKIKERKDIIWSEPFKLDK